MNEWRLLVTDEAGEVLAVEFHTQAATANDRAAVYRQQGRVTAVSEGRRGEDGTFLPS